MLIEEKKSNTAFKDVIAISFGLCIISFLVKHNFYLILGNAVFLFICLEFGIIRHGVSIGWRAFTHFLGVINSNILLTLIFFLIFLPVAMLRRVFMKKKNKTANEHSTFVVVETQYSAADLENMW